MSLDLRLLGLWRSVPGAMAARMLVPAAAVGLGVAVSTGALLFATRAPEYAPLTVFQLKVALVATGAASALIAHWRYGWYLTRIDRFAARRVAVISLACWLGALLCGRLIAFVA